MNLKRKSLINLDGNSPDKKKRKINLRCSKVKGQIIHEIIDDEDEYDINWNYVNNIPSEWKNKTNHFIGERKDYDNLKINYPKLEMETDFSQNLFIDKNGETKSNIDIEEGSKIMIFATAKKYGNRFTEDDWDVKSIIVNKSQKVGILKYHGCSPAVNIGSSCNGTCHLEIFVDKHSDLLGFRYKVTKKILKNQTLWSNYTIWKRQKEVQLCLK
jgi:hypothetical protein